ncbi:MAG: translation initiation factor IF-2 [Ignavibacteria bacterium]|nr:translation initiation factor IF-2 [Ignavibacteria bacterium]MBT8381731.1 translation initiation factor IF-2 [Ignavibacteria bacterium]MBT8391102.1 translation initiation factor IF-2 [Ignavibacteria bacterium]NNJ53683.1 translation initiation factor IF-2 [Ignavibacteriaceae bacterium]NNL21585.1 translation initiation factor IF-2 [Ignavibacteriaceae bacterium]
MTDTKVKKSRVYKLATEYNLSSESLIEFLKSKSFKVKNHMSLLNDEMIDAINSHYKKDIEKAEKHYKKIAEFHKKRAEKAIEEAKEEGKQITVEEAVQTEESEEIKVKDVPTEEEKETASEEPIVKAEEDKAAEDDGKDETVSTEKEKSTKVKGLKVIGKMDLDKDTKKSNTLEKGKTEEEKEETSSKRKKPRMRRKKSETVKNDQEAPATKKKRSRRFEVDDQEVKAAIRKTLLSMDDAGVSGRATVRKKKRKEREAEEEKKLEQRVLEGKKIKVNEYIAVNELANLMNTSVNDVISKCIELGLMVSINQRLDFETITLVADEFGFEVELQEEYTADVLEDTEDSEDTLQPRPPVVTIMGHVDHGKTSLLDYIRRTNVVAGESGGITQHIGAYRVEVDGDRSIAFLDTPGHEAFTAMRARGAQLTDIVVLVVAADDAVMPQTIEAINHAQAAGVPIVVAINKIDKPGANPEKIKQQLADRNILVEDWGGKNQSVELSAKQGLNVEQLLEKILLEAELLDLKANPDRMARGAVVEAELDKGRGITGSILIQKGMLKIGDPFVAGIYQGRVRAMFDERGKKVIEVGPSTPVQVLGFEGVPQAGDTFVVVESERVAREIGLKRQQLKREQDQKQVHHVTLDEIAKQISIGGVKDLPLIVKGDVDGSVEALADSLMKLSTEEVVVKVIHKGVGGISEGDVLLADASKAIIIGFHVRPNLNARKLAEKQSVDIRLYSVIYDAINEVKSALEGLLSPVISEEVTATLEVRDIFKVPKSGTVAGCYVVEGKITRNDKIRLIREGIVIFDGEIGTLRRFKDDVREVDSGYECGLNVANYNDVKVGDIIESYKIVETKKSLS